MINENFVFLGAILNLVGSTNYVYNTIKGRTKPNRVTWFLLALAPMIAFGAMLSEGVNWKTGLMTFMVGFGPLMVFLASFVNKKSVWKLGRFDYICGGLSLVGLTAWALLRTGEVAILFSIITDVFALLPTMVKAWKFPETEKPLVFFNGALSATITLLTIKVHSFSSSAFAVYILVSCVLLFGIITLRPKSNKLLQK